MEQTTYSFPGVIDYQPNYNDIQLWSSIHVRGKYGVGDEMISIN